MKGRNPDYEYTVIGRVELNELYDEWAEETDLPDYTEPPRGWELKYAYAFELDVCALLFENTDGDATHYYRVLLFKVRDGKLVPVRKIRFRETEGFTVDAIGVSRDFAALFVCRSNETVKADLFYDLLGDRKPDIRSRDDVCRNVQEQSDEMFPVIDGLTVLFINAPDGTYISPPDEDPHDILHAMQRGRVDRDEDPEDDEDDDDEDDGDDDDGIDGKGDEDNDDTACRAQAREAEPAGKSGLEELDGLVGLNGIKKKVKEIVAFSKQQKYAREHGLPALGNNLNLAFLGNPGTAKTTAARIFAKIMKENGILSNGDLIEVGRADLVAKYTGQTAIKVKGVFEKAKGNVLFIDEAYSLVDSWENEYGDEAIATMVQEMENNRDDMIVIFAGYPDKMEKFLSRNPGLRSRVPYRVDFEDYSAGELTEIAKREAKCRGYRVEPEAEQKILEICSAAARTPEFGNGRFSRNLVEAAVMKAALRTTDELTPDADPEKVFRLKACDIEAPDNMKEEKKTRVIGFRAA